MQKIYRFILALIVPVTLFGQIVIDYTEIPQEIGTNWLENNADSVAVNLGTTGGPQVWDFTAQPMGTDSTLNIIVDKASTPYSDSFPTANLTSLIVNASNDTFFSYNRLTNDSINMLGYADTNILAVFRPVQHTPLPIAYENAWISYYGFNMLVEEYNFRVDYYSHCEIDAYGTVKIPCGDFECLRLCSYDTTIISMPPFYADTSTSINYYFIAENYGIVVSVGSKEGETNPNFTEGSLTRLVSFKIGVKEGNPFEKQSEVLKALPNPFCSGVSIQYSVVTPSLTSLRIYDMAGNLIKTLANGYKTAGNYRIEWDGKAENGEKVTTGIYFYQLRTDRENCTKKIILVK